MSTYLQTAIEDALTLEAPAVAGALELGDGSPFVRQALDACWERLQRLHATTSAADNAAKQSADRIRSQSRARVDANPYTGITRRELEAIVRAAFTSRQPPEVLLALWAKEGSTRSVDAPTEVPGATTEANARAMFRSTVFFVHLGIDHFVAYTEVPGADNRVDISDAQAPRHEATFARQVRALVADRLLREDISAAVNRELTVRRTGGRFTVEPSTRFYALVLLLVDALFTKHLEAARRDVPGASPELAYMHWNMRLASWRAFVTSADGHRREPRFAGPDGQPITSERWALHTAPRENEFGQARRNAIRVMHYIDSYRPIFAASMSLITPGIEDVGRTAPGTRAAEAFAGALELPIEGYRYDSTGTECARGPQAGAVALVREIGRRFGGRGEIFACRPVRGGAHLSLHGEGRAVDWYRNAADAAQAAEAQRIIDLLMAPDPQGNQHALARRMGVQEIIWNRRIWTARRQAEGWRAYTGTNPHTDHLHIGLNWPGARMQTSFWQQQSAAGGAPGTGAASNPSATAPTAPQARAAAGALRNAADIDALFRARTGRSFIDWFNATQANRGAWASRTMRTDADTRQRWTQVWNGIPQLFGTTTITLEQFVALQSILINELGGRMAPITERMGRPGHPGMAYLFDRIAGVKSSYNRAPNRTALQCFNDADFNAAHGSLAPGSRLANTQNQAWGGQQWPAGEPTDMAAAPYIAQADFCRFRGRGLIQTTWRSAYGGLVRWIQSYSGPNVKVNDYRTRWAGQDVERVLSRSSNADWDDLFQHSDYVAPWAGVRLHNQGAGNYLAISTDPAIRAGTGQGSFHNMGRRISGSASYGDLFRRRCQQVLDGLAAAPPPASPAAQALEAGPPPASELSWSGATAEQLAFKRRVYETQVRRSARTGRFVASVPAGELGDIEGGQKARTAAADACRRLLGDARTALAAAQAAGDAQARTVERIGVGSAYRSVRTQFNNWNGGFAKYYQQTAARRQAAPGGEHGEQAAELTARYIGAILASPGYSLHNDGRAIDVRTVEGGRTLGASTAQREAWRRAWLFGWLTSNGARYGFFQNLSIDEPWHWEHRAAAPAAPAAPAAQQGASVIALGVIAAGQADVATVPLLAEHHDAGPDMILRWNDIADLAAGVDVVVHLHGFSSDRRLDLRRRKLPLSGLDFVAPAPPAGQGAPAQPPWTGRRRPTLLVLPRGRARSGHPAAYDFPALIRPNAFAQLVDAALREFEARVGAGRRVEPRRIILTAHSGGGAPLNRILARTADTPSDPHEVHVFDALYGDPSGLRGWATRRLRRDVERLQRGVPDAAAYMANDGGALRILYLHGSERATTRPGSLAVQAAAHGLIPRGTAFTDLLDRRFRAEVARVGHSLVPYWYGGRLLADVSADVPGP